MVIKCTVKNCMKQFKSAKALRAHEWMMHFRPGARVPVERPVARFPRLEGSSKPKRRLK